MTRFVVDCGAVLQLGSEDVVTDIVERCAQNFF